MRTPRQLWQGLKDRVRSRARRFLVRVLNPNGCHVVERWRPGGKRKALGLRIVIDRSHSANDLRELVRRLAADSDPAAIQVYDTDEAYRAAKRGELGADACRRGYLLSYAKRDGDAEITWMQERGAFARLFGQREVLS